MTFPGKISFTLPISATSYGTSASYSTHLVWGDPVEPAKLSDCPHKPGTIEHRDWIRTNVLDRQADPRTEAAKSERARIQGLTADRRVQMDNDRTRRAAELEAMIADLPEPNVDIPPDPVPHLDAATPGWITADEARKMFGLEPEPGRFTIGNATIKYGDVDMAQYIKSAIINRDPPGFPMITGV